MVSKQELLAELEALKQKIEGIDDEPKYYFLEVCHELLISCRDINELFTITKPLPKCDIDKPHGLGVYPTKEYAEMARACLIDLLQELKDYGSEANDFQDEYKFVVSSFRGKALIKEMENE